MHRTFRDVHAMNYYIYQNDENFGPFSREQMLEMLRQGLMTMETPCCQEGENAWQTVSVYFGKAVPPAIPTAGAVVTPILNEGRFYHTHYLLRRKILNFLGTGFHVFDPAGAVVFFSKQKAFKLREDIRVYADDTMTEEVLVIRARQIMDFSAAYDVSDPLSNMRIGVLRRKGFSSFLRDSWQIMDADDRVIGQIQEDNMGLAILRRWLFNIIPQHFTLIVGETLVADYRQRFNPFIYKMEMDFSKDTRGLLDQRLGIAAGILLAAIEGRQD
jgi:uncharacterized protein YxjI